MKSIRICTFIVSCSFTNTQISQEFRTVELQTLDGHSGTVTMVAYSPNGNYLALGSRDYTVKLWQLSGGKFFAVQTLGASNYVTSVAFSQDGNYLVSGSRDDTAKLWGALRQ